MVPKLQPPEQTLKPSPLLDSPALMIFPSSALSLLSSPLQRQAKYSENKLKCTKARNDYLLNLAATNAVVAKYYIHDVSDMIDVSMCSGTRVCLHVSAGTSDVDLTLQHGRFSHHLFLCHLQPVSCLFPSCSVGPNKCLFHQFVSAW